MTTKITITECPRDSWQGLKRFIPTEEKIDYLNALTRAGMRRIDFGSFVSPKAVPQMADTAGVFENMQKPADLYLIAIIGNARGLAGLLACNGKFKHKGRIAAFGYPLSVSETFQERNLGRTIAESWQELEAICRKGIDHKIDPVVYLSMAFGNPYEEAHSAARVVTFAERLVKMGVTTISLADTIGSATPEQIGELFAACQSACPEARFTAHFHSTPEEQNAKVDAAIDAGCTLIDSALGGVGGCPFAKDDLTGNIDTAKLLQHLDARGIAHSEDSEEVCFLAGRAVHMANVYGGDHV